LRDTIVVLLLVYAAVVAAAGSRWLSRAAWPLRAPRAAIAAWQAATLSGIASVVAAGVILAVPCLRISTDPAVLRACLSLMWAQYATPRGTFAAAGGSVLVVAVLGRITWCSGGAMACELIEVAADDAAIRSEHRLTLAGALLAVATAGVPAGALGAGGTADAQRIRRLIDPPGKPSPARRALTSATLAAVSIVGLATPALALITITHCPPWPLCPRLVTGSGRRSVLERRGSQSPCRGVTPGGAACPR
jgi:hypothetical protein